MTNLTLLCITATSSGLTIGEGSLECVASSCPNVDLETQSGYTICDGIPNSQPQKAGTLTATISEASTSILSSYTLSTSSRVVATASIQTTSTLMPMSLTTIRSTQPAGTTSSLSATSTTTTSKGTVTATQTPKSSDTTASGPRQGLGTAYVAGISGGIAAVSIIAVVFLIWYCLRNRRRSANSRDINVRHSVSRDSPQSGNGLEELGVADGIVGASFAAPAPGSRSNQSMITPTNQQGLGYNPVAGNVYDKPAELDGVSSTNIASETSSPTPSTKSAQAGLWPSPLRFGTEPDGQATSEEMRLIDDVKSRGDEPKSPTIGNLTSAVSSLENISGDVLPSIGKTQNIPSTLRIGGAKAVPRSSALMPLTPVYDNGNYTGVVRLPLADNRNLGEITSHDILTNPPNTMRSSYMDNPLPSQQQQSSSVRAQAMSKGRTRPILNDPRHWNKTLSTHTIISEDSTTEEEDIQPYRLPTYVAPAQTTKNMHDAKSAPRSPIHNLQYPNIPRPASVAARALRQPRPRYETHLETSLQSEPLTSSPTPAKTLTYSTELGPYPHIYRGINVKGDLTTATSPSPYRYLVPSARDPMTSSSRWHVANVPYHPAHPRSTSSNKNRLLPPQKLSRLPDRAYVAHGTVPYTNSRPVMNRELRPSTPNRDVASVSPRLTFTTAQGNDGSVVVNTLGTKENATPPNVMVTPKYSKSGDLFLTVDM